MKITYFNQKNEKVSHELEVKNRQEVAAMFDKEIARKSLAEYSNSPRNCLFFFLILGLIFGFSFGDKWLIITLLVGGLLSFCISYQEQKQVKAYNESMIES